MLDWLTRLSIASVRKSPNMISITGRSPEIAAPNAAPVERELRDRRVEDALPPVLLVQPGGHGEHAARERHVLAEEDDAVIRGQLLVERLAKGGAEVDRRRHQFAPGFDRSEDEGKRVLEQLPQTPEEARGVGAVDGAVVGRQGEIGDVSELDAARRRSPPGSCRTEPTARIATWGGLITAVNERTSNMPRFETVNVDAVSSSTESRRSRALAASVARLGRDDGERLAVRVDDRGHQQRILRGHGDADVHPAVALAPSVDERAVERGVLPQRQRRGLDDEVVHRRDRLHEIARRRGGAG